MKEILIQILRQTKIIVSTDLPLTSEGGDQLPKNRFLPLRGVRGVNDGKSNQLINKEFYFSRLALLAMVIAFAACTSTGKKNDNQMKSNENYSEGIYGYDVAFLSKHDIETVELKDENSPARVLVAPGLQGRVMTSTANGEKGTSFGWINYDFIKAGEMSKQFNPFGGEERLWLGPEGGPFSIYFKPGVEQVFANWRVPPELDTKPFKVVEETEKSVQFETSFSLVNAAGTTMDIGIKRKVQLLSKDEAEKALQLTLGSSLNFVAFQSVNTLQNEGDIQWNSDNGFLSIWLLCMFNPSEEGVVFIPFKEGSVDDLGVKVTDDYFGKVPPERLIVKDNILFFKTDGKYRSKIGISPKRAEPYCGSYDPKKQVLTLLWYSQPAEPEKYVNSKWGQQDDPLSGDAVNSYNDGPADDGKVMGPFYEIESSSPAALLNAGETITHTQRIFHISGDEKDLNEITEKLFHVSLNDIKTAFN